MTLLLKIISRHDFLGPTNKCAFHRNAVIAIEFCLDKSLSTVLNIYIFMVQYSLCSDWLGTPATIKFKLAHPYGNID